jgi:hypothetical protein
MGCVECGAKPDERAEGWRGYRVDDPDGNELPELAVYCPCCAQREFGPLIGHQGVAENAD